jgi:integrase
MTTRALTGSEIFLLESALIDRRRYRDRLFLLFALGTGFRVSEMVSLNWRQLLTASGEVAREVIVERAMLKGGAGQRRKSVRSRRVPLTERVRGAIADYLGTFQAIPGGVVFKSRTGDNQAITRTAAQKGQVGLHRNALDQALKGLRRDEGRHRQQRQIRRVETGPRRLDGDPHPSIQSLVGRQGAFGYASGAESQPDTLLPRATIR